jgi:hypothetical protein
MAGLDNFALETELIVTLETIFGWWMSNNNGIHMTI